MKHTEKKLNLTEAGEEVLESLKGGLVVSCQAKGGHPLREAGAVPALALCAEAGGAVGIRADSPQDVRQIKQRVEAPVMGIHKSRRGGRYFITPGFEEARGLAEAGADLIALEATVENRPDTQELAELVQRIREELALPVVADVSTFDEGVRARAAEADVVATTLSGYTPESPEREAPDFDLVESLAGAGIRVIAEGHVCSPGQVRELFERGAYSVVVGTAITDPISITSWFAGATARGSS